MKVEAVKQDLMIDWGLTQTNFLFVESHTEMDIVYVCTKTPTPSQNTQARCYLEYPHPIHIVIRLYIMSKAHHVTVD